MADFTSKANATGGPLVAAEGIARPHSR